MKQAHKYSKHSSIIWPVRLDGWVFVYKLSGSWFKSRCCHLSFRYGACFDQGVSWNSSNCRFRFILNPVRDMIITCFKTYCGEKLSQHSSIIWPGWVNCWTFVYKLRSCWLESICCHLNFRYRTCFEQRAPWLPDNYRV